MLRLPAGERRKSRMLSGILYRAGARKDVLRATVAKVGVGVGVGAGAGEGVTGLRRKVWRVR